ncbi:MAG: arginine--tRNA ligase [Betaproteobacteria bacterium]
MLEHQRDYLAGLFLKAAVGIGESRCDGPTGSALAESIPTIRLDPPREANHGDLACNLAMQLARLWRANPRELAKDIAARVREADARDQALVETLDVAGAGFINLRLHPRARQEVLVHLLRDKARFGWRVAQPRDRVMVEFVSANPTGPLHVGHGRQAALGDAICAMLEATGHKVHREFYYNDAGAQIDNLVASVVARLKGIAPDDPAFPRDGYRGDYIAEIAQAYLQRQTVQAHQSAPVTAAADPDDREAIRSFAVTYLRREQDSDLDAFGLHFDRYFLESSLYGSGEVESAVERIRARGHCYTEDGALWLRSTAFGDDKDRVMRKREGGYTYFVPDVAYHRNKWARGFRDVINVQGADHHGTTARVRAGLQALEEEIAPEFPRYVLHKMVTVMRGGEEVKISKRAGSYVTLRDLMLWSGDGNMQRGRDAVRFFLLSRRADTEFVFDIDLALARGDENPVYYVQYAHARICAVLRQAAGQYGWTLAEATHLGLPLPLESGHETALLQLLAQWPRVLGEAAAGLAPHAVVFFLRDLAAALHGWYNAERFLVEDAAVRGARLLLLWATGELLRSALALLGVSAPESM